MCYFHILAGPQAINEQLDYIAADQIGKSNGKCKAQYPPSRLLAEVHQHEYNEEQIEGKPEIGFPKKGKDCVKKAIAPILIDVDDQPPVYRGNEVPEC